MLKIHYVTYFQTYGLIHYIVYYIYVYNSVNFLQFVIFVFAVFLFSLSNITVLVGDTSLAVCQLFNSSDIFQSVLCMCECLSLLHVFCFLCLFESRK
jgi:hypothetical protein